MVKNRILGLVALLLGFGLVVTQSAFTSKGEQRAQFAFHYSGPSTMTVSEVQDEQNWTYDLTPVTCPSGTNQACSILIDEAYVDNPSSAPTLSSSAAITAELSPANKARVTGSADNSFTKNNRN